MTTALIVLGVAALALTGGCFWLLKERTRLVADRDVAQSQRDDARKKADQLDELLAESMKRVEALQVETAKQQERVSAYERSQREWTERFSAYDQKLRDAFKALAGDALTSSSKQFLDLARKTFELDRSKAKGELDQLVKPLGLTLEKTREHLGKLEEARTTAYAGLSEQVKNLASGSQQLRAETSKLSQSLRSPHVRGRYGEIQLQRVAELAGMRQYCDFSTQTSVRDNDGKLQRPDMIVRMPNGRVVAVDAKTNIEAYLDAIETDDAAQAEVHLDRFAMHVERQAESLAKKEYWSQFEGSPEFVVMFVPGDQFVDAALSRRPALLDLAAQRGVIIASPSTLIGLLRAVHVGWREKQLTDSAKELFELGRELHDRAIVALGHAAKVGDAIASAKDSYNKYIGSIQSRLLPHLRRFEEQGARSAKSLPTMRQVEGEVRVVQQQTRDDSLTP